MRHLASVLLLTLFAAGASAQGITTEPVGSSNLSPQPFQPQNPAGAAPAPQGPGGLGKVFDEADTNHDNVVTRQEFLALANRHFGMADTDKDGKITRDEMQAQQHAVMQQMQKNLFGNNWQDKVQQFIGGPAQAAPVNRGPVAPTVAAPTPPSAPTVH